MKTSGFLSDFPSALALAGQSELSDGLNSLPTLGEFLQFVGSGVAEP